MKAAALASPDSSAFLDFAVACLAACSVFAVLTISPELLGFFKIHYMNAGGNPFEKIHPATYLALVAFAALLLRRADPAGEVNRMAGTAKSLLVFFFACALLFMQCIVLKRPFTSVIDTFLLPVILGITIWSLPLPRRRVVAAAIHVAIWANIAAGFYEYFSKHRLIPITLGKAIVLGDWRSTAFLGHPLAAAGIIAIYIMALLLRPHRQKLRLWQIPLLGLAIGSLMVFGGRTALIAVLTVLAGIAAVTLARLLGGMRFGLTSVILATVGVMLLACAIPVLLQSGVFDRMIDRFSADNGSAHARIASIQLLGLLDWKEFLLGTQPVRSGSLQSILGLDYGIENFWIACIVQYGAILTALITIGLSCFFWELSKRTSAGARVALLFVCVVAASAVSFSSKNIMLTAFTTIILVLLPREPAERALSWAAPRENRVGRASVVIQ